ncbi:aspartate kinase [Ruminococcaceae bacterium YRB3002]|nr:aspartate kinase [Ruminococcaceae bacterium YRB3002]
MKVSKFGGTSLANAFQIQKVCSIVLSDPDRKVVVVSAPGKRTKDDIKVTDLLIDVATTRIAGNDYKKPLELVIDRFREICGELEIPDALPAVEKAVTEVVEAAIYDNVSYIDSVKAMGEDSSARIVTEYLNSTGHKAHYCNPRECGLFLEHNDIGKAVILDESYDNLSTLRKDEDTIYIFPGFYGYTKAGQIITFSRGGSDITGSILAAALSAEVYENWTDVDNVYAVNPNLVNNPFPIREITYDEMRELAYAGFTVLHEDALYPAYVRGIPINIKNTNNPSANGTWIVSKRTHYDSLITGIAGEKGFSSVTISKYLMNQQVGFLWNIMRIFMEEGVSIEHIPSGIDTISVVVRKKYFTPEKQEIICNRIMKELNADNIKVERDLAIVMIVGEAMANSVGIMARAASALSNAGINLRIVNQGASEISMMFGVAESYCSYAQKVLYKELFRY